LQSIYRAPLAFCAGGAIGVALSVVNGFLCFCSCDVKKALQGKNPHPKQDATNGDVKTGPGSRTDQPAVLYGGNVNPSANITSTAVSPASATSPTDVQSLFTPVDVTA
jgi:hypothetical protein